MIEACDDGTEAGLRDLAICATGYYGGLRRSEISRLKLGDLVRDGKRWILVVRKAKTGDYRKVAVHPQLLRILNTYLGRRSGKPGEGEPMFTSLSKRSRGRALHPDALNRLIKRRFRLAGLKKKLSSHSLRHSNATTLIDAGAPLPLVQDHLGHASPSTTIRYYDEHQKKKRSAVDYLR